MGRKQKKIHYIYKTTCNVNRKYYIGMHSTDKMEDGYLGSGKQLWNSINYHGKENFVKEVLEFCENREELKKREEEIVNEQIINEDLCMNLKVGGEGFKNGGEFKANEILNEKLKNNPVFHTHFKNRISEGLKRSYLNGRKDRGVNYDWSGKKHSEETKKKMSEKAKQRTGEKNSQYGTCWITKDGENKKIKKDLLSKYESSGWVRGRD